MSQNSSSEPEAAVEGSVRGKETSTPILHFSRKKHHGTGDSSMLRDMLVSNHARSHNEMCINVLAKDSGDAAAQEHVEDAARMPSAFPQGSRLCSGNPTENSRKEAGERCMERMMLAEHYFVRAARALGVTGIAVFIFGVFGPWGFQSWASACSCVLLAFWYLR